MKTLRYATGLIIGIGLYALADSSEYGSNEQTPPSENRVKGLFDQGKDALGLGNYAEAEKLFAQAAREESGNPDILNMLAYSQRKQGKFDFAFTNYRNALQLRPNFPQAREYLGEAHIQAALREIKILKSYGPQGEEELQKLLQAFKQAANELENQ